MNRKYVENIVVDNKWIELGIEYDKLKNDISTLYFERQKQYNKNIMKKYYNFETILFKISVLLDNLICKYYPYKICTINKYPITKIFYNMNIDNDNTIKTIVEIERNVMTFQDNLKGFLKEYIKYDPNTFMKIDKYFEKFHQKLKKIKVEQKEE